MSTPAPTPPAPPPRVKRSQFIEKLHDLLEHPYDPDSLRWTPDGDGFEITTNEPKARNALSPKWDFRSLSSFIRQLSYYNFKRLSDRRRSTERRGSSANYIVFSHPTGFFIRGDNTKLDGIVRKTRTRPSDKPRRDSLASTTSADDTATSPFPQYSGQPDLPYGGQPGPSYTGAPLPAFGYAPPGQAPRPYEPPALPPDTLASWRNYQASFGNAPPNAAAYNFASHGSQLPPALQYDYLAGQQQQGAFRRGSLSEFKVAVSPRSRPLEVSGGAPYQAAKMRTHSPLGMHDPATVTTGPSGGDFRHSPYPTPAFSSHSGSVAAGAHDYLYAGHANNGQTHTLPSGLPAVLTYEPLGHRTSYPPASAPATSSYTPLPPVLHQPPTMPSHLQTQAHLAAGGAARNNGDVLPSPTYSSEDDGPPQQQQQQQRPYYGLAYPSMPQQAQQGTNPFPHLTHYHPPAPSDRALQLPPFGPGPGAGEGKLGWAAPMPGGRGAFGQWMGFGAREGAQSAVAAEGTAAGAGTGTGAERGAGS